MLVLTRKVGEAVRIDTPDGHTITVRVMEIRGSQVRLGTDAPSDYMIERPERPPRPVGGERP